MQAEFQTPYILFELGRVQISLPITVTAMEAIATYRAVTFAKEIRHNSIVLDGDSTAFIDSLKNDEISLADYGHLIEVAKDIVGSFAI